MGRARWLLGVVVLLSAGAFAADAGAAPAASFVVPTQWCGTDAVALDRKPDTVAGKQLHVVYALAADGIDGFFTAAAAITTDLGSVDAWWRREDPSRAPRFDLMAAPGCGSELGRLDLTFARLPGPAGSYLPYSGRFGRLSAGLQGSLFDRGKKYLIYYDGPVETGTACGEADPSAPEGGPTFAFVYVQARGCGVLGRGEYKAQTAAHEFLHMLGAVPTAAPHNCGNAGHTCDNGLDIMHGFGRSATSIDETYLDLDHDDYYGHSGSWLDTQDSLFLRRLGVPQQQLTVTLAGPVGTSTVTSNTPGIECPLACAVAWDGGAHVTLAANPADNRRVVRWSGACTGTSSTCELTMDGSKATTVLFGPSSYPGRVSITGRGNVTNIATGFRCPGACADRYDAGQTFAFKATPAKGWRFAGWGGDCRGQSLCRLRFDKAHAVRAAFAKRPSRSAASVAKSGSAAILRLWRRSSPTGSIRRSNGSRARRPSRRSSARSHGSSSACSTLGAARSRVRSATSSSR